ncbi:MAG: hypothetical protein HRT61_24890 [Ekhidna sp.]|nr:hypothetical protein [Ekhidna sp.]
MNQLDFSFESAILLVACLYGFIFSSVLVFRNRKRRSPHFWLGSFLFVFTFVLTDTYFRIIQLGNIFPAFNWTYYRLLVPIPITLWVYVVTLVQSGFKVSWFERILLTGLVIELLFRIATFIFSALEFDHWTDYSFSVVDSWVESMIIVLSLITLVKSFLLIRLYRIRLENNYSEKSNKDLRWLSEFLVVLFGYLLLDFSRASQLFLRLLCFWSLDNYATGSFDLLFWYQRSFATRDIS